MLATAMSRKPAATSSGAGVVPVAAPISAASAANPAATIPASSGWLPSAPNTCGKCAGWIRPSMTLASVTVSGPPARYAAGPGSAPAESGPTRYRLPSNASTDPPPAATVWMLSIGARIRTPATCVSYCRSNSPAKCETSVDVPPMSKPITLANPAACAVLAMPTIPPAGPDKIASLPRNRRESVSPPLDCMNCTLVPPSSAATWST